MEWKRRDNHKDTKSTKNFYLIFVLSVSLWFFLPCLVLQAQESKRALTRKEEQSVDSKPPSSSLWAVVIGISRYKNLTEDQQLRYPETDARAFADVIKSPEGGGFASENIRLLVGEQATLATIRSALGTWLVRSAEAEDIVYIYFAGHGIVETDGSRDGYLVPYDADPQDFYATALSMSELRRIISERLKARAVVLITDACHAGTLGPSRRGGDRGLLISRYIEEASKIAQGSLLLILASRENELSYEDSRWGGGHGVFTYSLLSGLSGKADLDRDGVVRASELIGYVARVVPEETKAAQHPQTAGNFDPQMPLSVVSAVAKDDRIAPRTNPPTDLPTLEKERKREPKPAQSVKARSSPLVEKILSAINVGRLIGPQSENALDLYEQLLKKSPTDPGRLEVEVELGRALEELGQEVINRYLQGGRFDLKAEDFRNAAAAFYGLSRLRQDDKRIVAKRLFCEGRALIFEKKYQKACDMLKRSAEIDTLAAYTNNAMGLAYAQLKDYEPAIDRYRAAVGLAPRWGYPHNNIGNIYLEQGRIEEAEAEFKEAIALDPRDIAPYNGLANLCLEKKRYTEAENYYRTALKLEPSSASLHVNMANLYLEQKKYRDASQWFRKAMEFNPNDSYPHIGLGMVLMEQNRAGEAETEFRRAVEINPNEPVSHNALATFHLSQARLSSAESGYRRAIELDPNYPDPHYGLGAIYEGQGRHADAAREFELFAKLTQSVKSAEEARLRAEKNRKLVGK